MGPRSGDRGEFVELRDELHQLVASMGPRSGDRGEPGASNPEKQMTLLQWGRGPETAESQLSSGGRRCSGAASMGPRSGDRGEVTAPEECEHSQRASMG